MISHISIRVQIKRPNTLLTNLAVIYFSAFEFRNVFISFSSFQVRMFVVMCAEFCSDLWQLRRSTVFFWCCGQNSCFNVPRSLLRFLTKMNYYLGFFLLLWSEFLYQCLQNSYQIPDEFDVNFFFELIQSFCRIFPSTKVRNIMQCQIAKSLIPQIPH